VKEAQQVQTVPQKGDSHTQQAREHSLLTLDPGVGIWTVITFSLLLVILRRFAWTPILSSLEEREKRLQSSMQTAEEARNESKRIAEEQNKILAAARHEASEILATARKSGDEFRKKMEQGAKAEREKIIAAAEAEIKVLQQNAREELRKFSAELAIGAAEKLLQENLDQVKSQKLVEDYIAEMENTG